MAVVYPSTDDPQPDVQPVHPGLLQEAETHPIWAVVILGVLAVVGYALISRLRGGSSSPASTGQPSAATQPTTLYVPTANYFVNDVHNITNNGDPDGGGHQPPPPPGPGPLPPPGPPPVPIPQPTPNPGPGNGYNGTPLIPYGDYHGPSYSAGQFHWGQTYSYNGTTYEEGPGSNGALWGVPLKPGEAPFTLDQWNQIPIAPGGKVELYGPLSDYGQHQQANSGAIVNKGGGPPVVWLSDYQRSKPVAV